MKEKLDTSKIKEGVQVPPELGENFERFVIAAKKVIYADAFKNDLLDQFTEEEGELGELIAQAAMFGMITVFNESKGSMQGELMIPIGVYLVADLVEFLGQSGLSQVENEDIGKAMEHYVGLIMNFLESRGAFNEQGQQAPVEQQLAGQPAQGQPTSMGAA